MGPKRKIFRMTKKRQIIMERILTTFRMEIEFKEGYSRELIPYMTHLTEKEREEKLNKNIEETNRTKLYYDVLETVSSHEHDFNLKTYRYIDRDWKNEWDIPVDIFNEAIGYIISMLEDYKNNRNNNSEYYDEKINFLLILRDFVNN